jgi:transposase
MCFSQVQRVFIVEHYLASRSYLTCQSEFRDTFLDSPVPSKSTISRLVNRFRDTGSVQDRNRSGRTLVLIEDSLDDIRQTLLHFPRKTLRKLSLQSGLSYGSVHKATKILELHPYRVLSWSHYFSKLVAPSIRGSIVTGFLF